MGGESSEPTAAEKKIYVMQGKALRVKEKKYH
jgi:hypothetical protein